MLRLKLKVFEDEVSSPLYKERAWAPEQLVEWWEDALHRIRYETLLSSPSVPKEISDALGLGDCRTIEVHLCSRESLERIQPDAGALGIHLVQNPEDDPFGDETPYAKAHRVLVVSDKEEFLQLTEGLARDDVEPLQHLNEYLEAYLATVFHEITHAAFFAANAALHSPDEINEASENLLIDNDLFDCVTGYGISPVRLDGEVIWAEDIDDARELCEEFAETKGKELLQSALVGMNQPHTFPAAMGVADEFEAMLDRVSPPGRAP